MHNVNVCIVGLSGSENVKGVEGVGKSCLCSRFLAKEYDAYRRDHVSNISISDWHSPVVNKAHWLYWGSCQKRIELVRHDPSSSSSSSASVVAASSHHHHHHHSQFTSTITNSSSTSSNSSASDHGHGSYMDICFNLIEHTEFTNDETLSPFSEEAAGGNAATSKLQPYSKRCSRILYESPHKSVYRRKEQFSVQDYNYGKFPPDGLTIDGFICIVDTNDVYRRLPFSKQLSQLTVLLNELAKAKKHILIVSTKHDVQANGVCGGQSSSASVATTGHQQPATTASSPSASLVVNQCEKNRRDLEAYVAEMRKSSKELNKYLYGQFVESSADLNINVDAAFYLLALNVINSKHFNKFRNSLTIKYDDGYDKYVQTRHKMMNLYGYLLKHESTTMPPASSSDGRKSLICDDHHDNETCGQDGGGDEDDMNLNFNYKLKFEQFYSQNLGDVNRLIELYGISFVLNYFNQHMNKLLHIHMSKVSDRLVKRLPKLLDIFFPSKSEKLFYLNNPWSRVVQAIKTHKLYSKYIIATPGLASPRAPASPYMSNDCMQRRSAGGQQSSNQQHQVATAPPTPKWYENEYFFKVNQLALPYELFVDDCMSFEFESHVKLELEKMKLSEHKSQLLSLLKVNAAKHNIRPGKSWQEASVFVMGRECYESLSERERLDVYELFQRKLVRKAKSDYLEMLIENLDKFIEQYLQPTTGVSLFQSMLEEHQRAEESLLALVSSSSSSASGSYSDMLAEMIDQYKSDQRHQRLDRLESERKSTFVKFIEFVFGKMRNSGSCLFGTFCTDHCVRDYLLEHLKLKSHTAGTTAASSLMYSSSFKKKSMAASAAVANSNRESPARRDQDLTLTTGEEKSTTASTHQASSSTTTTTTTTYNELLNNKNDSLESFGSYKTTSSWSSCHSKTTTGGGGGSSVNESGSQPAVGGLRRTRSASTNVVNVSFICLPQLNKSSSNPFKADFNLAGFRVNSDQQFKLTARAYILSKPDKSSSSSNSVVFKNLLNKIRVNSFKSLPKGVQSTNGLVLMVNGSNFQAETYQAFVQVLKKIRNYFNQMKKQDSAIHKSMKLFVVYDERGGQGDKPVDGAEKNLLELCERNMISFMRYNDDDDDGDETSSSSSGLFRAIVHELVDKTSEQHLTLSSFSAAAAQEQGSIFQPKRSLRKNNSKKLKNKLKRRSSQKSARHGGSSSSSSSGVLNILCLLMCNNNDAQVQCILEAIKKHIKLHSSSSSSSTHRDDSRHANKVLFDAYVSSSTGGGHHRKQRVCLEFMSYHKGIELLKSGRIRQRYQGFIMTFTSHRLASLKCAETFAKHVVHAASPPRRPNSVSQVIIPRICFVCISSGGVCDMFKDETSHSLILMGNQLADSFRSKFLILSSKMTKSQYGIFGKFFQECATTAAGGSPPTPVCSSSVYVDGFKAASSPTKSEQLGDIKEDYMGDMGDEDVSIEAYLLSSLAKQEAALKGMLESRTKPHEKRVIDSLNMAALSTVIPQPTDQDGLEKKQQQPQQSKAPLAKAESIESELFKSYKQRSIRRGKSTRRKKVPKRSLAKLAKPRIRMACDDPRLRAYIGGSNLDDLRVNALYKEHFSSSKDPLVSFRLAKCLPTLVKFKMTRSAETSRVLALKFSRRVFKRFKTIKSYPNYFNEECNDELTSSGQAGKSRGSSRALVVASGRKFNRYFQKTHHDSKIIVCNLVNTHSICSGVSEENKLLLPRGSGGDKSSSFQDPGQLASLISSAASTSSSISFSSSYSTYSNQEQFVSLGNVMTTSHTIGSKLDRKDNQCSHDDLLRTRKKQPLEGGKMMTTATLRSSKESSSNKTTASASSNKLDFELDSMETCPSSLPVAMATNNLTTTPVSTTLSKLSSKKKGSSQLHTTSSSSSALASNVSSSSSSSTSYTTYQNIAANLNNKRKTLLNDFQLLSFVQPASSLLLKSASKHHQSSSSNVAVSASESSTSIINSLDTGDKFTISIENEKISLQTGVPIIVDKCLAYIEEHGLDSEGIYRIPGNKQYTDSLLEDLLHRQEYVDLKSYNKTQINVNIVSTVIKDYFRHLREPILCNVSSTATGGNSIAETFTTTDSTFCSNNSLLNNSSASFSKSNGSLEEYIELSRNYLFPSNISTMDLFKSPSLSSTLGDTMMQQTMDSTTIKSSKSSVKTRLIAANLVISSPVTTKMPAERSSPTRAELLSASDDAQQQASSPAQLSAKQIDELAAILADKFAKFSRIKYLTLKAVFMHLRLVASHSKANSMDSNNLAICWWPTLLRPNFTNLNDTQVLCKILKPFVQFLIDHADLVFKR